MEPEAQPKETARRGVAAFFTMDDTDFPNR